MREKKKNPSILNPIQREINSKILQKKTQAIGAKKKKKNLINPKSWLTSRSAQESEMQRMVPSFGTSQFRLEKNFCEIPVLIAGDWVDFAGRLLEKLG